MKNMIGKCTLEPKKLRAPKGSYTFEVFNVLQKLVNSKIVLIENKKDERFLTEEEIEKILKKAHEEQLVLSKEKNILIILVTLKVYLMK